MRRQARSSFVTITIRTLAVCLALAVSACHARPAASVVPELPTTPFTIRITPSFVFERSAVRVTCFVPWDDANRVIRFGIEGISVSMTDIDRQQYTRVYERMECGTWLAVCRVADNLGKVQERTQEITVKGMCNDGGRP